MKEELTSTLFFESLSVKLTLLDDKGDRNRGEIEKKIETSQTGA